MQKLTKTGAVESADWNIAAKGEELNLDALASGNGLIHLDQFIADADTLAGHDNIGVWLDSNDDAQALAPYVKELRAIAVHFPAFTDGRGFSLARVITGRLGFKGELLATGAFMQDQLFYLKRCGFDAFLVDDDANIDSMRQSLVDFENTYQAAADEPRPIYLRR